MKVEIDGQELFNLQTELHNERVKNKRLEEEMFALKKKFSQENFEQEVKMAAEYLANEVIRVIAEQLGFTESHINFDKFRYNMFEYNRGKWFLSSYEKLDVDVSTVFTKEFRKLILSFVEIPEPDEN